jgi:nitrogen fixation protein FixH
MSLAPSTPGFRIKGWHVFAGVFAFFAVIIAVDGVFLTLALRTFPGQVSVTPYEDGLLYNRHIAQMEAQDRLGWQAAAQAQPRAVVVTIRDRAGAPLPGLRITGRLERPATEAGRLDLQFHEQAPGRYAASPGGLLGTWDLTLEARGEAGAVFQAERRLTWP